MLAPVDRWSVRPLQNYRCVDPAKAERVADRVLHTLLASDVRDVVEVASIAGLVEVERGWEPFPFERERGDGDLERAGRAEGVAVIPLRAAHLKLLGVIAEHLTDRGRLDRIVERRGAAVRV